MQKRDWKIWRGVFAALFVIGVLWGAVARSPFNPQSLTPSPEQIQQDLQQWLMQRQKMTPGLENQLRAEWQARVRSSRQPRLLEQQLTDAPSNERMPAWSPDRRTIAFVSNGVDTNNDGKIDAVGTRYRIWLMNPDGSNQRPAIPDANWTQGDELYPSWSWDSGAIAFVLSQAGVTDIWTVNLRTGLLEQRTRGMRGIRKISWSPTGTDIVFEQNNNIFKLDLTTGQIRQLTSNLGNCRNPAYLPDGRILFESNFDPATNQPGAYFHIWIMRSDGSQPQRLTSGDFNDIEPAAVFFTHPESVIGRRGYISAFTSDRNGNKDIFLLTEGGVVVQVSPPGNRTQDYQPTVEPFPMEQPPYPQIKVERIAFVSTRTGNEDIWLISSFDVFPPILANKDGVPTLPSVTPRQVLPGDTVTIRAHVLDPESGVNRVFAVIKSADDPLFLWSFHYGGFPTDQDSAWIPHEADWKIVDPNTGQLIDTLELQVRGRTFDGYLRLLEQYGIPLYDDGDRANHGDERAGDGIYSNKWKVPVINSRYAVNGGVDFYVDIVPIDNAGNYPQGLCVVAFGSFSNIFLPNDGVPPRLPSPPGPGTITLLQMVIGYDNITGFTSKPFTTTNYVLLVSDYACGQKWTRERAAGLGNVVPSFFYNMPAFPAEAWYFDLLPEHRLEGPVALIRIIPAQGKSNGAYREAPLIRDQVDVWRTLCRGPIPDEILGFYLPRRFVDPLLQVERLHAEKCVIWVAPYTGNLWVDRGTLEDPVTQNKIIRFLQQGGRLFISSGQDLGWALTLNGSVSNDFLVNWVRARFSRIVGGYYGDYYFLSLSPERHKLEGPGNTLASGVQNWGQLVFDETRLGCNNENIDPDAEHRGSAGGIELLGFSYPTSGIDPPLVPPFSGDGCQNALVMDTVELGTNALEVYHYTSGGLIAGVQYRDPGVDYRIVTFFFPYEGLNTGFSDCNQVIIAHNYRATLMHYIMDFLRTGVIEGKVVDTQGNPLEGVTVRAQIGLQVGQNVFGSGVSLKDGFYTIIGLNAGVYDLDASVPGYQATRLLATSVHGSEYPPYNALTYKATNLDFRMTKLEPGAISGKVTELDGVTPIVGATVKAELVGDEQGNPIPPPKGIPTVYTTTTKANGTYRLEGLPNGTYNVTASAPRHTSVTRTGIVVRPGQETTGVDFQLPGEPGTIAGQVVDAQTNQGIAGALVEVISAGTTIASATTDAQGNFVIPNVPVGVYTVQASAPNYKPASVTGVQVQTAATTRVTIQLARAQPGSISGRVTRADGTPVGGVTVEVVQPATGEVVASGVTEDRFTVVAGYQRNYLITNVPLGTYTVRVRAPGYTSTPTERTGVIVQEATETQNINFVLRAQYTFARGVQLISIPYDYTGTGITINQLLGTDRIITWVTDPDLVDPMTGYKGGRYVRFPTPPADAVYIGRGYFVRFDQSIDFTQPGSAAPSDQPFPLVLDKPGWWLIGAPFPFKVDWMRTKVMNRATNETLPLRDAALRGWLSDTLFALNQFATGYVTSVFVEPFKGYWVYVQAPQGVVLLIDNTPTRQMVLTAQTSRSRQALMDGRLGIDDGWLLPLKLTRNGQELSTVQIGVSSKASDNIDPLDLLTPPSLRQWVPEWVTFASVARAGRSETLLYADVRAPSARPQVWDLVIEANSNGDNLTVSWDNLNERVPSDLRLILIDPDTGETRYMRTTSGYSFALRDGVKRLRIVAERRLGAGLRIVGVKTEPTRGGQLIARFTLTESAEVEVKLLTLTGRLISVVQPRRLMPMGEHRIVWDGRSVNGGLPKGSYLLEIKAYGERGEQVRGCALWVVR
jgi:protocatechuate 3,4-dioxygenase beta subunit